MIDFSKISFAKDVCPCGYYPENSCVQIFNMSHWFESPEFYDGEKPFPIMEYYGFLKRNGFCRYSSIFYRYACKTCRQCTPVRVPVNEFKASKNQRAAWNKNQDIEVTIEKNPKKFISEERALLFREYDAYHNSSQPGFVKKTLEEALASLKEMNTGYEGTWNIEYRYMGRLIGVGIIDLTYNSEKDVEGLCSNYFYYEISPEIEKRSIGVFSVLKELELAKELGAEYYYLGLYLAGTRKMNYKINYEPYELLIDGTWISSLAKFPEPGEMYPEYEDISFVSSEIDLPLLLAAYKQGVFPWFNEDEGEPVVWRSPDPRFVIPIEDLHVPKTLEKFLKHSPYTYTMDKAFSDVMLQCSLMEREGQNGTWIGKKMLKAYEEFHKLGYAHSIEVWNGEKLVGGFYGILLGSVFCGESMFTIESNSSSSAFVLFAKAFRAAGGKLIDCQAYTSNMARYGAKNIPRVEYLKLLKKYERQRIKNIELV